MILCLGLLLASSALVFDPASGSCALAHGGHSVTVSSRHWAHSPATKHMSQQPGLFPQWNTQWPSVVVSYNLWDSGAGNLLLYRSVSGLGSLKHVQQCACSIHSPIRWSSGLWLEVTTVAWGWHGLPPISCLNPQHCPTVDHLAALAGGGCRCTGVSGLVAFTWPAMPMAMCLGHCHPRFCRCGGVNLASSQSLPWWLRSRGELTATTLPWGSRPQHC